MAAVSLISMIGSALSAVPKEYPFPIRPVEPKGPAKLVGQAGVAAPAVLADSSGLKVEGH